MTTIESNNSGRQHLRNPAEYIVLGAVTVNPTHGYELVKFIQTELKSIWKLKKSQIYGLLDKLEHEGLLDVLKVDQEKAPAKKIFSVTSKGHNEFRSWMEFNDPKIRHMRIELLGKVFFAIRLGGDPLRNLIGVQLKVCEEKADRLRAGIRNEPHAIDRLALSFRLSQVQASIQWLTETYAKHFHELCGMPEDTDDDTNTAG